MIVFDIETGPLSVEEIQDVLPPFDIDSIGKHPGEFDPDGVKLGAMKDPEKIRKKIEDAAKKHIEAVKAFEAKQESAEADHWADQHQRGALSSVTGQVVAIGYRGKNETLHLAVDGVSERSLLVKFWKVYGQVRSERRPLVGFNIKGFDIPFLAQRSWVHGIPVPPSILTPTGYLESTFVDLLDRWKCGVRWGVEKGHATLDTVCRACGLPGKSGGITGAEFAQKLWSDDEADREQAREYLAGDLEMTAALAERLGVG